VAAEAATEAAAADKRREDQKTKMRERLEKLQSGGATSGTKRY
jgi:hypothetical protein